MADVYYEYINISNYGCSGGDDVYLDGSPVRKVLIKNFLILLK